MKIPKQFNIGGFTYKVIYKDYLEGDTIGLCLAHELTICLAKYYKDTRKPIPQEIKLQTFYHELLHAIDAVYLQDNLSEETIDKLSQGLYQFLKNI